MKKGFTLLELIIVMGIMAALLGISTIGLIQVKATIELQNAFSDVSSALQSIQNEARNSVSKPGNAIPDYFAISFKGPTYVLQSCVKTGSRITCTNEDTNLKATDVLNVTIEPSAGCDTVGFARLTGDIVQIDSNGIINTSGSCSVKIVHNSTSNFKEISIDLNLNNITGS